MGLLLAIMVTVTIPNDFTPRPYQAAAMRYFDGGGKRAITVWHRRAGKDLTALHQTCKAMHQKTGAYWHFFPTFSQGVRAIWEGYTKDGKRIMEMAFPGFLDPSRPGSIVAKKNEAKLSLELKCGSIWRLMGTDRTESVGAGPQGVVFSEFALCRPGAWDLVRPMLRESGGWAWFITTPRGNNHAKQLYDAATPSTGWYRDLKGVYDTGLRYSSNKDPDALLGPDEMMSEERAEGMEEATVRQEYLCDFTAANVGSIWGDLLEQMGDSEDFAHSSDDVFTNFDLGINDSTAIWFWRLTDTGADFIDYYENSGQPLSHYVDLVQSKPYKYAQHWLPHDARARTLVTGQSVMEHLRDALGSGMVSIVPGLSLPDGLQAGRWLLQQKTRFHGRCKDGLAALKHYHRSYDVDLKVLSKKPEHDWSSHGADAFRYAAIVRKVSPGLVRAPAASSTPAVRPVDKAFTLDELFEAHSSGRSDRI